MKQHRNSQKRYYENGQLYFIVTKTFNNFPYFKEQIFCDLLIEELKLCKELKKFKLYAFSIIYDHLNLLIEPNEEFNISKVMKSLKENTSRDINYVMTNLEYEGDPAGLRDRLRIRGFLDDLRNRFLKKYDPNKNIIPKFKWSPPQRDPATAGQKSFRDHIIRDEKDFSNHYYYTAHNHLKHKLPDGWKYTSLNYKDLIDEFVV